MITTGLTYTSEITVSDALTAVSMGSGDMPVLATPAMIALMENAAMNAVAEHLPEGCTTVGAFMETSHLRPTALGQTVKAVAEVVAVEQKKIEFTVKAFCGETLLGEGHHTRYVVDREKFLSRL